MSVKRQSRTQREGGRVLSFAQEIELICGFPWGDGPRFANREEMEAAWYLHRERLLAESAPFRRPRAYFVFEVGYRPKTGDGSETHRDVLLRMKLPLTPAEQAILRREGITL